MGLKFGVAKVWQICCLQLTHRTGDTTSEREYSTTASIHEAEQHCKMHNLCSVNLPLAY